MKLSPTYLDFEGMPILHRSTGLYPSEPVSMSFQTPSMRAPKFMAWGHRTGGNNCTKDDALRVLQTIYKDMNEARPLVMQNAKFDLEVCEKHFGLAIPPWCYYHDTMFLLFLDDPHQRELGLKPSAARLLDMPQDERDAVEDWILEHKAQLEADYPEIRTYDETWKDGEYKPGGIKPSNAGAFIGYAPGKLVGPYANGDIVRTKKLFELLHKRVTVDMGMGEAYDRERRLMPILLRSEQEGMPCDVKRLEVDLEVTKQAQAKADAWLRKRLKTPGLDFNKDRQVAEAFDNAGVVKEWVYTSTGQKSVAKDNLKFSQFGDKRVASAFAYRNKCATMIQTFMGPWLRYAEHGTLHTNWNQVRQSKSDRDTGGTRTGRPSSDHPNFLNLPKKVKDNEAGGFVHPTHIDVPELPRIRSYIVPSRKGNVVCRRDFNQQELRVLAHFEDGALLEAYLENPRLDVHEFVQQQILILAGLDVDRTFTKTLNFGYVYGQGVPSMAQKLDRAVQEVKAVRDAQMRVLPGLADLTKMLKARAAQGEPITTWGGRKYFVEPPKFVEKFGRVMTFDYKLLNYLVQGSSADITKEAIIRYDEARKEGRFLLSVYDEIDIDVPKKAMKAEMLILRDCMMGIELDVPLLSDGEWGPNLGDLEDLKEPAPDLSRWRLAA